MKELICILGTNRQKITDLVDDIRVRFGYKHIKYVMSKRPNSVENECVEFKTLNELRSMRDENKLLFFSEDKMDAIGIFNEPGDDTRICMTNAKNVLQITSNARENGIDVVIVNIIDSNPNNIDCICEEWNDSISAIEASCESTARQYQTICISHIADITLQDIKSRDGIFMEFSNKYMSSKIKTLNSLDLSKIKYTFVDFDDTACLHKWLEMVPQVAQAWQREMTLKSLDWYIKDFYSVNPTLKILLEELKDAGSNIICVTWSDDTCNSVSKKSFIDIEYSGIFDDYLSAGTREAKVQIFKRYIDALNLDKNEVLIIDDHPSTLNECRKEGFYAISPVAVQGYVFNKIKEGKVII